MREESEERYVIQNGPSKNSKHIVCFWKNQVSVGFNFFVAESIIDGPIRSSEASQMGLRVKMT